jgi:hypothetical protein
LSQDKDASVAKFYPNPATTAINFDIKLGNEKGVTLKVFNFMGKSVFETTTTTPTIYISLDRFNRGVYIYQLRNKFGRIIDSGRFQVVK